MTIRFIFYILPVLVIYGKLPLGVGGRCYGPYVKIAKYYQYDRGIEAHELEHCRQFYITGFVAWSMWLAAFVNAGVSLGYYPLTLAAFSAFFLLRRYEPYKYWSEVVAYREQLKHHRGADREQRQLLFAKFIATRYGLNVSATTAYRALN